MSRSVLIFLALTCLPLESLADSISIDFGDAKTNAFSSKLLQIIALLSVLSIAPSILIMITSFTRIAVVLSFLRTALGLQQTPPNQVLTALALFLTMFIMAPTFDESYEQGIKPLMNQEVDEVEGFHKAIQPFKVFMLKNTRGKELDLFAGIAHKEEASKSELPIQVIAPAFMLSELRKAFEIGFLIFLPFLIIDMLVASTLMAMGMMMIPPVVISLPFKLIFFVLVDGWYMLCGSLIQSYG